MGTKQDQGALGRAASDGADGDERLVTILLANESHVVQQLEHALRERTRAPAEDVDVQLVSGSAMSSVAAARRRHGGLPLGYVAEDEEEAMLALSEGADEVMLWPPRDDHAVLGFVDRTRLRARIRKQHERSQAALVQAEKLTALGTLVAGVAHEVNNPLTALQLSVEALSSGLSSSTAIAHRIESWQGTDTGISREQVSELGSLLRSAGSAEDMHELLSEMLASIHAISNVVKDLRVFARTEGEQELPRLVDPNDVVDQALRLVWRDLSLVASIERDFEPDLPPLVVPQSRLTQVLLNILVNAAQAVREVQRPSHRVRISTRADDDFVAISVADTGPGIPDDGIEHIFDPFFTTKRAGMGTGLGLSISRSIMVDLGGDLIVESVHGTGATFVALIPIPDRDTMREAFFGSARSSAPPSLRSRRSVLVIDDDERVLRAYARLLGRSCNVLIASDGREAMDLLESGSKVEAIISELSLPEVDGPELFRWLLAKHPKLAQHTLFVAADSTRERYTEFLETCHNEVLSKPLDANSLLHALTRTDTES